MSAKTLQSRIDDINNCFGSDLKMVESTEKKLNRPTWDFHTVHPLTGNLVIEKSLWSTEIDNRLSTIENNAPELLVPVNMRKLSTAAFTLEKVLSRVESLQETISDCRAALDAASPGWEKSAEWKKYTDDATRYAAGTPEAPDTEFGDDDDEGTDNA